MHSTSKQKHAFFEAYIFWQNYAIVLFKISDNYISSIF